MRIGLAKNRFALLGTAVLAIAVPPVGAQEMLPASFAAWNAAAPTARISPAQLEQFAGNDAAVLREYGLQSAEQRQYSRNAQSLTIVLYRMQDASAAYGAYTFLRDASMAPNSLTRYSCASRTHALIVLGNLLLDATGKDLSGLAPDWKALLTSLAPLAEQAPFPTIGQYLPEDGLVSRSEHYLLGPVALNRLLPLGNGDWLGFYDSAEAVLARYRINGQEATLLLAEYPTQQIADQKFQEIARWFALNASEGQDSGHPALYGKRSSALIAIVANASSREVAESLLKQIHYESLVTWNEPTHRFTDPSWGNVIVGAITGTGMIMLLALAAGIGFGGVRVLTKLFLPGRVFDRSRQVEILQLGLSSKPIQAKDFY